MCEVEWHGQITEHWYPRIGFGEYLSGHSIQSNDERPFCEPSQEQEGPGTVRKEELGGVDDICYDTFNKKVSSI